MTETVYGCGTPYHYMRHYDVLMNWDDVLKTTIDDPNLELRIFRAFIKYLREARLPFNSKKFKDYYAEFMELIRKPHEAMYTRAFMCRFYQMYVCYHYPNVIEKWHYDPLKDYVEIYEPRIDRVFYHPDGPPIEKAAFLRLIWTMYTRRTIEYSERYQNCLYQIYLDRHPNGKA